MRARRSVLASLCGLSLTGCRVISEALLGSGGVPLEDFSAMDGRYFPTFVEEFFEGARLYTQKFPALSEARSEIRLIQVKRLTFDDRKSVNEANLSWSADGVYLSYESVDLNKRRIQVKNLRGDYSRDLLVLPKGRSDFLQGFINRAIQSYNAGLSWSRDSTRFAFMSNGGIGEYNIYVGAVGAPEKPIARSPAKDGYAAWSPTDNELAFVSARSGNGDIYAIDLDGDRVRRLSDSKSVDLFPTWFPDGKKIVYSSGDSNSHNIVVLRNERGMWSRPYPLTDWSEDDLRPTVSPNGELIAFYASASNRIRGNMRREWRIVVVPYRTGQAYRSRELSKMIVAEDVVVDLNTGPAWSPDSRKIFYVKHEPERFNPIYAYDLFTGRTYRLKTNTRMNRDILMSNIGILSFRAQVGAWDRVFLALTNQGRQLQTLEYEPSRIHYGAM